MREWKFGCVYRRELVLRWYAPYPFRKFTRDGFCLSPWRLLNPLNWWKAIRTGDYEFWYVVRNGNHRCYCTYPHDRLFDGRICIAGFGCTWFYSNWTGPDVCACDEIMAELFPDEECSSDTASAQ